MSGIGIADAKMPTVYPQVWVGKSSDVPADVRKNGIPYQLPQYTRVWTAGDRTQNKDHRKS